ncbi:cell cycle checkpoint protein RAD17-like [Panonychus citri]|uniref:cell cycle checkpoint protein RAD17-like n=1 Tax=Panonychus citri TaxID=50023 RepID=UPI0023071D78|nr:cell cycle checkpoint protein RAD17-like [Panonychus citri]
MEQSKNIRKGFVDKFAGAFTCHSISLNKDKKRPMLDGSPPESESLGQVTGFKKILSDHKKGHTFVDILRPTSKNDLLVNVKKISDVECWFKSLYGKRSSGPNLFLIVSGPSGSGKLTTIKILAQERDIETIEFVEMSFIKDIFSVEEDDNNNSYGDQIYNRSQIDNMKNFLVQANVTSIVNKKPKNKRLIIIKDLPSTLLKEPEKYHQLWTWYYNEFNSDGVPVVFIISCDPGRESIKIFPSQLKVELNVLDITFNPIVKTRIIKWLTDKLEKKISKQDIESIVEEGKGDIRNILNCFELKCSSTLVRQRSLSTYKRNAKKPRTESYPLNESNSRVIWGRDASLELYHFLGKILFSKRDFDKPMRKTLPKDLLRYERHHLNENPFLLCDSYDLSPSTLNLFLHQNYLHYAENLESAANTIEWLSQGDCIRDDVYDSDSPLEKYQSCLSIAGLMFNLSPNAPVKVKIFDDRRNKSDHSHESKRTPMIVSNRAYHLSNEKTRESKSIVKRSFNDKSTSLVSQHLILDILPYVSVMNSPRKNFSTELLKISSFPNISSGGFNGSQEVFRNRQTSINLIKECGTLEMDNQDESDEDKHHYIIEDDSN